MSIITTYEVLTHEKKINTSTKNVRPVNYTACEDPQRVLATLKMSKLTHLMLQ